MASRVSRPVVLTAPSSHVVGGVMLQEKWPPLPLCFGPKGQAGCLDGGMSSGPSLGQQRHPAQFHAGTLDHEKSKILYMKPQRGCMAARPMPLARPTVEADGGESTTRFYSFRSIIIKWRLD